MMMKDAYGALESSEAFKSFSKRRQGCYLTHAFATIEEGQEKGAVWQFGFFDRKADRMSVFDVGAEIKEHDPQEVYKHPDHEILHLAMDEVKFTFPKAMEAVKAAMKDKYKGELANKYIVILQNIPEHGTVWNITVLSTSFHVINFKIDAGSGEIKAESRESLTTWNNSAE